MIRKLISLFFGLWAALFAFAFYERYFQWRNCFNELGRCYVSETGTVYVEQAGFVWALFFFITAIPALYLWFRS